MELPFRSNCPVNPPGDESSNSFFPSDARLLLGEAMDCSQSPDELNAVDADYLMLWQVPLERFHCLPIAVRVAIGRHQQRPVDEVEVDVGGGQTLALVLHDAGHRDLDDLEGP